MSSYSLLQPLVCSKEKIQDVARVAQTLASYGFALSDELKGALRAEGQGLVVKQEQAAAKTAAARVGKLQTTLENRQAQQEGSGLKQQTVPFQAAGFGPQVVIHSCLSTICCIAQSSGLSGLTRPTG
eukprot:4452011-Amphidinium_carterae.1